MLGMFPRGVALWVGLSLAGLAAQVTALEYHVDSSRGDDGRTPLEAQNAQTPWASLQRAAEAVKAGDTVWVHEGTYPKGVVVSADGSAEKPILFSALGKVIVRNSRELPKELQQVEDIAGVWAVSDPGPVSAVFENPDTCPVLIEVYRPVKGLDELSKKHGSPKFFYDAKAKKLYLKPFTAPLDPAEKRLIVSRLGTALHATGSYVTFEGFRVEFGQAAVYLAGHHNTARRIQAYHCAAAVNLAGRNETLEYSVILACGGGITAGPDGTIRNNTIYGTRSAGLGINESTSGKIVNNIFWAGGVSGPNLWVGGVPQAGLMMDHNVWLKYSNPRGRMNIRWGPDKTFGRLVELRAAGYGQHSLQLEPLFVSTERGKEDLHLRTRAQGFAVDSPCINAGTPPGTDIGAFPAPTPVPQRLKAEKTANGVHLHWQLPYLSDTIIDGFYVYRRAGTARPFERLATLADPGAREYVDTDGKAGHEYEITTYRPGGTVESAPSGVVTAR